MLNRSENQIGQEVRDEASNGKSLGPQLIHFNALVACKRMHDHNSEEVSEAWSPKLVEAVEESAVGIANSPEPKRWAEVDEVLLSHVGILLVLLEELRQQETTVHGGSEDATEKHSPKEEASIEDMTGQFNSVGSECVWHQSFKDTIENNGCAENYEVNENVTHANNINELIISRPTDDVNIDYFLRKEEDCLHHRGESDPEGKAKFVAEFISLFSILLHARSHLIIHAFSTVSQVLISLI